MMSKRDDWMDAMTEAMMIPDPIFRRCMMELTRKGSNFNKCFAEKELRSDVEWDAFEKAAEDIEDTCKRLQNVI